MSRVIFFRFSSLLSLTTAARFASLMATERRRNCEVTYSFAVQSNHRKPPSLRRPRRLFRFQKPKPIMGGNEPAAALEKRQRAKERCLA